MSHHVIKFQVSEENRITHESLNAFEVLNRIDQFQNITVHLIADDCVVFNLSVNNYRNVCTIKKFVKTKLKK